MHGGEVQKNPKNINARARSICMVEKSKDFEKILTLERDQYAWSRSPKNTLKNINVRARSICMVEKSENLKKY